MQGPSANRLPPTDIYTSQSADSAKHINQSEDVCWQIALHRYTYWPSREARQPIGRQFRGRPESNARHVLWKTDCCFLGLWHSSWQSCLQMTCVFVCCCWSLHLLPLSCDLVVALKDWDVPLRCSLCSSRQKTLTTVKDMHGYNSKSLCKNC